jgi:hypothetical protein
MPSSSASRARRAACAKDSTTSAIWARVIRSHGKPWTGSALSVEERPFSYCTLGMSRWRPEKASWTM